MPARGPRPRPYGRKQTVPHKWPTGGARSHEGSCSRKPGRKTAARIRRSAHPESASRAWPGMLARRTARPIVEARCRFGAAIGLGIAGRLPVATSAEGSSAPAEKMPRGRWYLKAGAQRGARHSPSNAEAQRNRRDGLRIPVRRRYKKRSTRPRVDLPARGKTGRAGSTGLAQRNPLPHRRERVGDPRT